MGLATSATSDGVLIHSRPIYCRVVAIIEAAAQIRIVRLEIVSGGSFRFAAGQYARVTFGEQRPREYSMANTPDDAVLEFHVRHANSGGTSAYVAQHLRVGDGVWVEGPFGQAWLREDHRGPLLAIAGGSGLAPVRSIVETAIRHHLCDEIYLYVGARDEADLYLDSHFTALAAAHPHVRYVSVLSEAAAPSVRRIGTVIDAVFADIKNCTGMKAYVAGPPAMVKAAAQLLQARGLSPDDLHSDLFDPTAVTKREPGTFSLGDGI